MCMYIFIHVQIYVYLYIAYNYRYAFTQTRTFPHTYRNIPARVHALHPVFCPFHRWESGGVAGLRPPLWLLVELKAGLMVGSVSLGGTFLTKPRRQVFNTQMNTCCKESHCVFKSSSSTDSCLQPSIWTRILSITYNMFYWLFTT